MSQRQIGMAISERRLSSNFRPLENIAEVVDLQPPAVTSLEELRRRALETASDSPDRRDTTASVYDRSRALRDYVVARSQGRCEGCEQEAPFRRADGSPYLEPLHIRRLSDGGPDHPRFVIALCPNCHRRVHHGDNGDAYNAELLRRMAKVER